jgi:hypothetical protein
MPRSGEQRSLLWQDRQSVVPVMESITPHVAQSEPMLSDLESSESGTRCFFPVKALKAEIMALQELQGEWHSQHRAFGTLVRDRDR